MPSPKQPSTYHSKLHENQTYFSVQLSDLKKLVSLYFWPSSNLTIIIITVTYDGLLSVIINLYKFTVSSGMKCRELLWP